MNEVVARLEATYAALRQNRVEALGEYEARVLVQTQELLDLSRSEMMALIERRLMEIFQ